MPSEQSTVSASELIFVVVLGVMNVETARFSYSRLVIVVLGEFVVRQGGDPEYFYILMHG